MITAHAKTEKKELIDGPAGQLEVVTAKPTDKERRAFAVVCHPHPLFGGTMDNKVVTTLSKVFQHAGLHTVRFNFRGVGHSAGEFDHGDGELDDLMAVIEWMQGQHADCEIWLAGFSFGAYVAARAATLLPAQKLVLVAPAVDNFPMKALPPFLCPLMLVQGDRDEVVAADSVYAWAEGREPKPIILRFPEAGHFFHGQLVELRVRLEETLLSS